MKRTSKERSSSTRRSHAPFKAAALAAAPLLTAMLPGIVWAQAEGNVTPAPAPSQAPTGTGSPQPSGSAVVTSGADVAVGLGVGVCDGVGVAGGTGSSRPASWTPANATAPAAATPTANVNAATPPTFTPTSAAPWGLTALARIARPSHVRVRITYNAPSTIAATAKP